MVASLVGQRVVKTAVQMVASLVDQRVVKTAVQRVVNKVALLVAQKVVKRVGMKVDKKEGRKDSLKAYMLEPQWDGLMVVALVGQ